MPGTVKISPTITLELEKGGQKITVDIDEARRIIKDLYKFVREGRYERKKAARVRIRKIGGETLGISRGLSMLKVPNMSEGKRKEILEHINRQLSPKPKTLSSLLRGVRYVPNHLPHIRKMIESQRNVAKEVIGKRTFYYRV
jgi:hypothetical protein